MQKVNLRRINEWDAPAMLKIYGPYADSGLVVPDDKAPTLQDYIQRIDKYTYGRGWIMCEIDNVPAGICLLREADEDPDSTFISDIEIYVKPEFMRRHVGTALFAFMRDIMQHGNKREVCAKLFKNNKPGIAFYTTLGFTQDSTVSMQKNGQDIIYMRYKLQPIDPSAERATKPYLILNHEYERVRELAQQIVMQE